LTTKPHRLLLDRVSGYADEAAAYLRRRRHQRKPFARTYYRGGRALSFAEESTQGAALFDAGRALIELAGPSRGRTSRDDPSGEGETVPHP
jgi:hypothetical protein